MLNDTGENIRKVRRSVFRQGPGKWIPGKQHFEPDLLRRGQWRGESESRQGETNQNEWGGPSPGIPAAFASDRASRSAPRKTAMVMALPL